MTYRGSHVDFYIDDTHEIEKENWYEQLRQKQTKEMFSSTTIKIIHLERDNATVSIGTCS